MFSTRHGPLPGTRSASRSRRGSSAVWPRPSWIGWPLRPANGGLLKVRSSIRRFREFTTGADTAVAVHESVPATTPSRPNRSSWSADVPKQQHRSGRGRPAGLALISAPARFLLTRTGKPKHRRAECALGPRYARCGLSARRLPSVSRRNEPRQRSFSPPHKVGREGADPPGHGSNHQLA